jgi:hypothetical protein
MPGFIVADEVSHLLLRETFVAPPHSIGMQETEAICEGEGEKASRIQDHLIN